MDIKNPPGKYRWSIPPVPNKGLSIAKIVNSQIILYLWESINQIKEITMNYRPNIGDYILKENEVVIVESVGMQTDQESFDDDIFSEIKYLINDQDASLFKRASVTIDLLVNLGFQKRPNSHTMFTNDIELVNDNFTNFRYVSQNGQEHNVNYLDELQKFYFDDKGEKLVLK